MSDTYVAARSTGSGAPRCSAYFLLRERREGIIPEIRAKSENRYTSKFRKYNEKVKAYFLLKRIPSSV